MRGEEFLRTRIARHAHPRRLGYELAVHAPRLPVLCGLLDAQSYSEAAETIAATVNTLTASDEKLFAVTLHGPYLLLESNDIARTDSVVMVMNRKCSVAALAEAIRAEDSAGWAKGVTR